MSETVEYDAPWLYQSNGEVAYDGQVRAGGVWFRDLDTIRLDGGTQPRGHLNHEVIQRYADALEAGAHFPPLTVFQDGENYWLADGFHRTAAYRMRGITSVPVQYIPGSLRDAQWFSFSVNARHGYPRDSTDVEKILARIFLDPEWSNKPVREIAEHVSVHHSTVVRWRDKILYKPEAPPPRSSATVVQAHQDCENKGAAHAKDASETASDGQYDLEDAIAAAQPPKLEGTAPAYVLRSFPPEHAKPASRIRELVSQLYREMNLSPADAARAAPGDPNDYRRHAGAVAHWLSRLEEELKQ